MNNNSAAFNERPLPAATPLHTGRPFDYEGFACIPIVPDAQTEQLQPAGFILSRSGELSFVTPSVKDARSDIWEHLMQAMQEGETSHPAAAELPTEYWYG